MGNINYRKRKNGRPQRGGPRWGGSLRHAGNLGGILRGGLLKDWTAFEKVWLTVFCALVLAATLVFSWTGADCSDAGSILLNWALSPLSAITGMFCMALAAKGSIRTYLWGLVNSAAYGCLAYASGYYGAMLLSWAYFLPMQAIGFLAWRRRLRPQSRMYVKMKTLRWWQWLLTLAAGALAAYLLSFLLNGMDSWLTAALKRSASIYTYIDGTTGIPHLGAMFDASTEALQIIAQILMALCYAEQWWLWILVNAITAVMWALVIAADPASLPWALPTLIMWAAYLVNSVYGLLNWKKGAKPAYA